MGKNADNMCAFMNILFRYKLWLVNKQFDYSHIEKSVARWKHEPQV